MKEIVEYLNRKNVIFKSLKQITPKELGSRKKVALYLGVNLKGFYAIVMRVQKKSRVVRKEADELMQLHRALENYIDSRIMLKYIIIDAPICSQAKAMLEAHEWKVWVGV